MYLRTKDLPSRAEDCFRPQRVVLILPYCQNPVQNSDTVILTL